MARGLIGKAVRGSADGLNKSLPLIAENQRHENRMAEQEYATKALATRDARLAQFATDRQAADQEFAGGQNQLDRDARQAQYDAQNAFALAGLANDNQRTSAQIRQINAAIESSELALEDQRELRDLMESYGSLEPEQRTNAIDRILLLQGKDPRLENEFRVVKQYDNDGYQIGEALVELSPGGSAHRRIDVGSLPSSSGAGGGGGGQIPDADIQAILRANPQFNGDRELAIEYGRSIGRFPQ